MSEVALFALSALVSVVGAVLVVVARDPFVSALSLIVNFTGLGVLYLVLHAPFVAMSQVVVYAGAVVVLFLFVIAYLGDRRELTLVSTRLRWTAPASVIAAAGVLGVLAYAITGGFDGDAIRGFGHAPDAFGSAAAIGERFLTTFLLQFEATSLVLMVAAIGGVVLGLTGRTRHRRLRMLQGTRSADQQRRAQRGVDDEDARLTSEAIDRLRHPQEVAPS